MIDFLHHLLFPRESNNHRAKILHYDSLMVIICLFLFCISLFAAVGNTSPQVLGISFNITSSDLLTFTNQKRQEHGLAPLSMNGQLAVAAEQKANHMFTNNYWAHIAPDGTTPWFFIKNSGYEYLYAGENLARGFTGSSDVIEAWMNSPTHRENMLSKNYTEVGFAIKDGTLTGSDTVLVVEMLGSKYASQNTAPKAEAKEIPTPTAVVAQVTLQPASQRLASTLERGEPSPTAVPIASPTPVIASPPSTVVAAVQNKPLIDSKSMTNKIVFGFLILFIVVLIIDAVIVEKKQIARLVSHNLDHVLFLIIIILVVIIIGRGVIL